MFLITLTYTKPLEIVDKYLAEHREFLQDGYEKNYFIVSGPLHPRTGGIILSSLNNREELLKILTEDPFCKNEIAEYDVKEFIPVKYHTQFAPFID